MVMMIMLVMNKYKTNKCHNFAAHNAIYEHADDDNDDDDDEEL